MVEFIAAEILSWPWWMYTVSAVVLVSAFAIVCGTPECRICPMCRHRLQFHQRRCQHCEELV